MTQNQETGVGQGELELCLSGYTREGVHAKMQPNAGQDEPASKARESLAYLKPEKAYTPTTIKDILEADDVEIGPRKRDLAELIRAAYPKALNKQIYKASAGKRQRRWIGIGATPGGQKRPTRSRKTRPTSRLLKPVRPATKWECQLEASDWQAHLNDLEPIVYVLAVVEQGWYQLGS